MIKRFTIPLLLLILGYFVVSDENIKIILSGIAIFIIGMNFMEDGFKLFSGGALEKLLERFTNNTAKAIITGFLTTSVVQSSSLISVITISFLSVGLITLTQGIGIIFGSNLGSTTTAWLVALFGLKLKISSFAMPMIIFGVVFRFFKQRTYNGLGNILLGLGFIFLGISYMKDGFETLKSAIDLASFAMEGYLGVLVYIAIGFVATIVIQSSSATIAIIITALSADQIVYENALALAIGSNIGTTVTAILGSLTSNENGKRLAFSHFVFNITTGLIAFIFIYQISTLVGFIASSFNIAQDNYTLKLAIFHTLFNVIGILVVSPFTSYLVKMAHNIIKDQHQAFSQPKYLDDSYLDVPESSLKALSDEVYNLFTKSHKAIFHAISLHKHQIIKSDNLKKTIEESNTKIETNIDEIYKKILKDLYSAIIRFASLAQRNMTQEQSQRTDQLKIASKETIDVVKEVRRLQKNTTHFLKSSNIYIQEEYNNLREEIAHTLKEIIYIDTTPYEEIDVITKLEALKEHIRRLDLIESGSIDTLIRDDKIDSKMATSLINDTSTAYNICTKLITIASILFIQNRTLHEIGEDDEY